ncbi:MAG: hypothetical protein AVDCRST_MAG11-3907, partial [uncultured Gemmatimonadaceae bacterium]
CPSEWRIAVGTAAGGGQAPPRRRIAAGGRGEGQRVRRTLGAADAFRSVGSAAHNAAKYG